VEEIYENDHSNYGRSLDKGLFWSLPPWFIIALIIFPFFLSGCAESGYGVPSIVVHQYNYQVQPPALAPDTPPSSPLIKMTDLPSLPVSSVNYKTIYESSFDDPTMVVFVNRSWRPMRVQIDDEPEFPLGPYQATTNIHLPPGEHLIRKTVERPTKLGGAIFDWVTFTRININIALNGRSQVIYLND